MAPPPRKTRGGPPPGNRLAEIAAATTAKQDVGSPAAIVRHDIAACPAPDPAAWQESWTDTALHLYARGLLAGGVPSLVAARLRRQGIPYGWEADT